MPSLDFSRFAACAFSSFPAHFLPFFDPEARAESTRLPVDGRVRRIARPWHIDVAVVEQAKEIEFLRAEIYRREVDIRARTLTALERFSGRA